MRHSGLIGFSLPVPRPRARLWLVKQYLGLTVPQTFKTWTVVECLISVVGLIGVLILNLFV